MKTIAILGSTGSVGSQTVDIALKYKDKIKVKAISASKISEKLIKQIKLLKPEYVYIENPNQKLDNVKLLTGEDGLKELCNLQIDLYINAVSGINGIKPTYYLLNNGKNLATANKEAIICLGEILKEKYKFIFPIDSEHSAIFQVLKTGKKEDIKRIILTASGGPFLYKDIKEFENITIQEALSHPKWKMGNKITIDSATLMNKGLEVIEAHYLFDIPYEKIDVVIHPDSIIHGMVEFIDGTVIANLSMPDMRIPISYAISYPERWIIDNNYLDFSKIGNLKFLNPDKEKFPLLDFAIQAGKKGSFYPIVLTVADEIAVSWFLEGKIKFIDIPEIIQKTLEKSNFKTPENLDDILNIIDETKKYMDDLLISIIQN